MLSLTLFLTACASAPGPVRTETVQSYPPETLLRDCERPAYPATGSNTNGALARFSLAVLDAIDVCNADKAGLREWVAKNLGVPPTVSGDAVIDPKPTFKFTDFLRRPTQP